MTETLVAWFTTNLTGILSEELIVFVISMVKAIIICVIGNLIPIPFILAFITPIFNWLKKTKWIKPKLERLEEKSMGKSETIQKYEFIGLMLFVGIPLPGTGAWTGALIASLLNIKIKKAFPAVICGVCIATVIMCIISYFIPWLITSVL